MNSSSDRVDLQPGMEVVSRDGDKLGKVVSLDETQLTVEKGRLFPKDSVIPMSAVESADDHTIYLNLSKHDALNQNWSAATRSAAGGRPATAAGTGAGTASGDALLIPVHEEELTATKRAVDAGQVEITTNVVSEDRTLEVPVTEERVQVTRRVVNRDATGSDAAFQGGTLTVPVQTEQVDLQKRVRVAEEVEVAKQAVQKTHQVSGTVRREVVTVADNTTGEATDATTGAAAAGDAKTKR